MEYRRFSYPFRAYLDALPSVLIDEILRAVLPISPALVLCHTALDLFIFFPVNVKLMNKA